MPVCLRQLTNTPAIEIWPAHLVRAHGSRQARVLSQARRVLRRKCDGVNLVAESAFGLIPLLRNWQHAPGMVAALDALKVRGAILIGILAITVLSMLTGHNQFSGVFSAPPSIAPTFLQLDIMGALSIGIVQVILVLVLVEVFDATGTLVGVAKRANLLPEGKPNRLGRALFADSTAIVAGSLMGTSSTTAYVESASGVQAGGRTGLTALVVGVLFLLALLFSPLAGSVPGYATAPALVYVACLMLREVTHIEWDDITESAPAALTTLAMPFTYSIANGLAFGFISYVALKALTGRFKEIHLATLVVAVLFVIRYAIE